MFFLVFSLLCILKDTVAIDSLKVAFQWKQIDYDFPSPEAKWDATNKRQYIPENNLPLGLEVYGDRIFITLPRWKEGVAASLTYIKMTDNPVSPLLRPYPDWETHNQDVEIPGIVSAFRIRADSCGRLWVIDSGYKNMLDQTIAKKVTPRLLIFDLTTDKLIRTYEIPKDQWHTEESFFANIAVDEKNCDDSFTYLADLGHPALVVYDYKQNKSWMIQHHYFNIDPLAGKMNVSGISFQWEDGLFGLALSEKDSEGYSTLYFHPMTSFNEFKVSTKILTNEELVKNSTAIFGEFKLLGSRGPKAQSGVSFLHKKTGVLFYALINLNAVACWRTSLKNYTMESQGRVFMSNELMVFPNDIKVDANDTIWVLSDKLPIFMYKHLNYREYNFRILKSSVKEAITGTTCDSTFKIDHHIMKNITLANKSKLNITGNNTNRGSRTNTGFFSRSESVLLSLVILILISIR
ncbi:protein yellow [Diorhabda carinulata]|uniref:protein yellow n=1 Tax=Diorhabda carinulata TaxID=1163345 RepID=UPI0025A27BEA|nr:protein yellow [Diorhabda carinulata]XP_057653643.1 protein yellow [Diorhabda carinulata]XP_057653644.1 protein yellow [Diorhabda carinulata]